MLSVQGLTKDFDGFVAVKNVSFEVAEGEILGLIGPNGSGKSTTFNLIAGALRPSAGSVRFRGAEIGGLPPDHVALAAFYGANQRITREEAYRRASETLTLVGLRAARVENLGAAGLKKLELARALATQPKLLLADESLGGLDHSEMDAAADLLATIRAKRGIANVSAGYGGFQALFDVSLHVNAGESVAVIGPNGAGKTTLLRLISKLIEPTRGDVVFD